MHFIATKTKQYDSGNDKCNYQMSQQNYNQTGSSYNKPARKPVTNPNIKRLNQQYASRITTGEIQVVAENSREKLSPEELYDLKMKHRKLESAAQEKTHLQKKLDYVNKSIESIKTYDYSSGKHSTSPQSRVCPSDPMDIIKKNKQFHERVKEEKRVLEEKKLAEKKRHEEREKKMKEEQEKKQEQQKAKKKQEILENMKKIKNRMDHREEDLKKRQQDYHKVIGGTTLFKRLQKQQALNQSTVLEERKKKLANIRNLHKPISMFEIEQHQKKFFEALQEKQDLRNRERRLNNAVQQYRVSYKSPRHKAYSMQLSHQETNQSKIKADKMRQFAEHVRQNFAPQIDEKKREEIEKSLEEEEERRYKQKQFIEDAQERAEQIRNKGLRYLEEVKQAPKKKNGDASKTSPVTQRIHYKNYLTHSQHSGKPKWGSILDSKASRKEKAIRMKYEAQKMQNSLKLKEQKVRLLKDQADDVDNQYYEMIKAKLQLLQC